VALIDLLVDFKDQDAAAAHEAGGESRSERRSSHSKRDGTGETAMKIYDTELTAVLMAPRRLPQDTPRRSRCLSGIHRSRESWWWI
jgi:hypothetical protein